MNSEYIEDLRAKLVRRVEGVEPTENMLEFHFAIKRLWEFLVTNSVFLEILNGIEPFYSSVKGEIEAYFDTTTVNGVATRTQVYFQTEWENVIFAYFVLKNCANSDDFRIEYTVGSMYRRGAFVKAPLDVLLLFNWSLDKRAA